MTNCVLFSQAFGLRPGQTNDDEFHKQNKSVTMSAIAIFPIQVELLDNDPIPLDSVIVLD